jgi:hypothetical protein
MILSGDDLVHLIAYAMLLIPFILLFVYVLIACVIPTALFGAFVGLFIHVYKKETKRHGGPREVRFFEDGEPPFLNSKTYIESSKTRELFKELDELKFMTAKFSSYQHWFFGRASIYKFISMYDGDNTVKWEVGTESPLYELYKKYGPSYE